MVHHLDAAGHGKRAFQSLQRTYGRVGGKTAQLKKLQERFVTLADYDVKANGGRMGVYRQATTEAREKAEAYEAEAEPVIAQAWRALREELSAMGQEART
jgi:hypothetical protein